LVRLHSVLHLSDTLGAPAALAGSVPAESAASAAWWQLSHLMNNCSCRCCCLRLPLLLQLLHNYY
jgi:hypothetical protein